MEKGSCLGQGRCRASGIQGVACKAWAYGVRLLKCVERLRKSCMDIVTARLLILIRKVVVDSSSAVSQLPRNRLRWPGRSRARKALHMSSVSLQRWSIFAKLFQERPFEVEGMSVLVGLHVNVARSFELSTDELQGASHRVAHISRLILEVP